VVPFGFRLASRRGRRPRAGMVCGRLGRPAGAVEQVLTAPYSLGPRPGAFLRQWRPRYEPTVARYQRSPPVSAPRPRPGGWRRSRPRGAPPPARPADRDRRARRVHVCRRGAGPGAHGGVLRRGARAPPATAHRVCPPNVPQRSVRPPVPSRSPPPARPRAQPRGRRPRRNTVCRPPQPFKQDSQRSATSTTRRRMGRLAPPCWGPQPR
jgi:hypothetical protein